MWYVYLIQNSETKENYFGSTNDLDRRLSEHNSGSTPSTNRKSGNWELIYYEAFISKKLALRREDKLKSHGRAKQELMKRIME